MFFSEYDFSETSVRGPNRTLTDHASSNVRKRVTMVVIHA